MTCWQKSIIHDAAGLGARGKRGETVADEAVDALLSLLKTSGSIDQFPADQLLLPLALSKKNSVLRLSAITQHLLKNMEVIQKFLGAPFRTKGRLNSAGEVEIRVDSSG